MTEWINNKIIALHGKPISALQSITCHMGSHSVILQLMQVNALAITPTRQFTYPGLPE